MAKYRYYAVARGRIPGIYTNWGDCNAQVHQFSNPLYEGFHSADEANLFMSKYAIGFNHSIPNSVQTHDGQTEVLADNATHLLSSDHPPPTVSRRYLNDMVSHASPVPMSAGQAQQAVASPPTSHVINFTHVIIFMFACTLFLLVLILVFLALIFYRM